MIHVSAEPSRAPALSTHLLRRMTQYVQLHLGEDISLAAIANELAFSPFHLAHVFKQTTGLSLHQYVLQQRMARAKALLSLSRLSLVQIAAELGFANQSHFGTVFKKCTGATPKGYRNLE